MYILYTYLVQQVVGLQALDDAGGGRGDEDLHLLLAHLRHQLVDHGKRRQVYFQDARGVDDDGPGMGGGGEG